MITVLWLLVLLAAVGAIVWGAEVFAEHLAGAAERLGVSSFALALLLAGAEPEELATAVAAALRGSPGVALGDVIGANVTICIVALGVGAVIRPLPFRDAFRYAVFGLPLGVLGAFFAWDGVVGRREGVILVLLYIAYVGAIWYLEKRPPAFGEVGEIAQRREPAGYDLLFILGGIVSMALGATVLVEAVRRITMIESTQTKLGLTVVGFATGFELVVLAWSASRHGASEAVVAGVVGSFSYNVTMTLGAAAIARPLTLYDTRSLHLPLVLMIIAFSIVIVLASRRRELSRFAGVMLLLGYPAFVFLVLR